MVVSGYAAGQAITESLDAGRSAFELFTTMAADEMRICEQVHEDLSAIMGFNVFMRP